MSELQKMEFTVPRETDINEIFEWIVRNAAPGYLINMAWSYDDWGKRCDYHVLAMIPKEKQLMFKLAWGGA